MSILILANLFSCISATDQGSQKQNNSGYNQYNGSSNDYYGGPSYNHGPYRYQQPSSRYYNNPYSMPPQNYYPYYDGDQYYVPPTYYGNSYHDNNPSSINQKY